MKQPKELSTAICDKGYRQLWKCPECGKEVTRVVDGHFGIHFTTTPLPEDWRCDVCKLSKFHDINPLLGRQFSI